MMFSHFVSDFHWADFLIFVVVSSATPGPNVILLAGSGGLWGLRRTLPHLFGITFGLPVMVLAVSYGSDKIFKKFPWVLSALTVASLLYVLWLSIRVYQMGNGAELRLKTQARPMSFFEAVTFQWINGKAWQLALTIVTLYATHDLATRISMASALAFMCFVIGVIWIELGKRIAVYLKNPVVMKVYYSVLALALILSTWPTGLKQLFSTVSSFTKR